MQVMGTVIHTQLVHTQLEGNRFGKTIETLNLLQRAFVLLSRIMLCGPALLQPKVYCLSTWKLFYLVTAAATEVFAC